MEKTFLTEEVDSQNNAVSTTNENTIKKETVNTTVDTEILTYLKSISESMNTLVTILQTNFKIVITDNIDNNNSTGSNNNNNNSVDSQISNINYENNNIPNIEEIPKIEFGNSTINENTLIISYIDNTVILPFTIKELNEILANHKDTYSNLNEIIVSLYTKPLQYYKNSSLSRFKEAFKLIREREKGSLKDALDLGLEVFANYNIHPAIITACKDLNEFDVYLSCLEYNELEDFHFFKIEFLSPPTVVTKKKNFSTKLNTMLLNSKNQNHANII